jgi:hypothetical protein
MFLRRTRRPQLESLEARRAPAAVTDPNDVDDYDTDPNWKKDHPDEWAGPNGLLSLHEAINEVNKEGGSITFSVPSVSVSDTSNPLPPITKWVTITGTAGGGGGPSTVISGAPGTQSLVLTKGGEVSNLVINLMGSSGLELDESGSVTNCYIGTDVSGSTAAGNSGEGIAVFGPGVTVTKCVIGGNAGDGIGIDGDNVSGVKVQGNMIGVDVDGQNAIPNGFGVFIGSGAHGNTVGGTSAEDRNIISGNTQDGVDIGDSQNSPHNTIEGNYIGVGADGTTKIANGSNGVDIQGSSDETIGGTSPGARNIIAGNGGAGVDIESFATGFGGPTSSNGNKVLGDYIGIDVNGALLKNGAFGVDIGSGSAANIVGGPTSVARNIIAGASGEGILLQGTGNKVLGNYIGTGVNGTETGYGNLAGIEDNGTGNTIGGPAVADRNIISGNTDQGIYADGQSATIQNNWIGLNVAGNPLENADGVEIAGGSENKVLDNVISANTDSQVKLTGGSKHTVAGNLLGLSPDGTAPVSGGSFGVDIENDTQENVIGGPSARDGNVIAGYAEGIIISGGSNNKVEGNFIGAGKSGSATGFDNLVGIEIQGSGTGNTIGGSAAADRNIISGNRDAGISDSSMQTTIQNNYIGISAAGTILANQGNGIELEGTGSIVLDNLISGNGQAGIASTAGVTGASIRGNKIGTDRSGKKALPNTGSGIQLQDGTNNIIGGLKTADSNTIANNGGTGITFDGGTGNLIEGNSIFSNGGLGISLVNNANGGQTPPTITSATRSGSKITIKGTVAGAISSSVIIELYANSTGDSSGSGEGQYFLGEVTATTDANGNFTAVFTKAPPAGAHVLSTTVRFNNGTSAFSLNKSI